MIRMIVKRLIFSFCEIDLERLIKSMNITTIIKQRGKNFIAYNYLLVHKA